MYSPKIRDDLIPRLYRMGKAMNKPMTHVVDEILRSYFGSIDASNTTETPWNESPFMKSLGKYTRPEKGEEINTDFGAAEILKIIGYDETAERMARNGISKDEIDRFTMRVKHFLIGRDKYYKCLIRYDDGEFEIIDWSQYLALKNGKKSK